MSYVLAAYLHQIDPFAIRFPDGWFIDGIRWYGLSYLMGFATAYLLVKRVAKVGVSTLEPQRAGDMVIMLAIGIMIGGRLGYVLFYKPDLLWSLSDSMPYWDVLAINKGGMASHGGMIGGVIASWWYARRHKHNWAYLMDLIAFSAPLGLMFGRIANFINGELVGRRCPEDSIFARWSVKFPQDLHDASPDLLKPLIDRYLQPDALAPIPRYEYSTRIIEAIQAGHVELIAAVEPMLQPRYPSQLIQAFFEGVVMATVMLILYRKPRKPLVIGSTFFIVYGVLRIVSEHWRLADAHLPREDQLFELSRGQWLSIGLILAGSILLYLASRRNVERLGGWMPVRVDAKATEEKAKSK